MKFYYSKKLIPVLLSGIVLIPITGCDQNRTMVEGPVKEEVTDTQELFNHLGQKEEIMEDSKKEDAVVDTITSYYEKMIAYMNSEEFKEKEDIVLSYFFEVTDFLFYGSEMNGVTLKELSEETQLKLVEMYHKVDDMIESHYPNYQEKAKNQIHETWDVVKTKAMEAKDNLNKKVKESLGEEKYNAYLEEIEKTTDSWKKFYTNFKEAHGEEIKENTSSILDKAKETGNKALTKINDWYQNLKENHTK